MSIDIGTMRQQADLERSALRERLAWLDGRIAAFDDLIAALRDAQEDTDAPSPPADPE